MLPNVNASDSVATLQPRSSAMYGTKIPTSGPCAGTAPNAAKNDAPTMAQP